MTNFSQIKETIDGFGDAFDAFKKANDQRFNTLQERVEGIEAKGSNPKAIGAKPDSLEFEHKSRFEDWLRKPQDSDVKNSLGDIQKRYFETKAVSVSSDAAGGFAVPEQIGRDIERLELLFSPVRSLVMVRKTMTADYKELVNIRGAAAGWVGESGSRTETDTSLLRERAPTFGEIYAYPQTTEWALDDMFFNVGDWLAEEVAQQFAVEEGLAVIDGDGSNKPTGMLDTDPVLTDDFASPLRAAAAYEYIPCDTDDAGSPADPGILGDCLIDLVYRVNSAYRARASWTMNSATAAVIRKLKNGEGNYLWQPALSMGQPEMLLGYPVAIWEQMPDIAANAFPVAFGDFRRGYLLADRTQIRITVDSNITTPGRIKYFVRRREGGCVLNNDAIKFLRTIQ